MAGSLRIRAANARSVLAVLELQGYVKAIKGEEWITTLSGEEVSGSRTPRYTPERVEDALRSLSRSIGETNHDSRAPYKIF